MLTLTVDSGLRGPRAELPEELLEVLRQRFIHKNPTHFRLKAMRKPYKNEPETLPALVLQGGQFRLTRGALAELITLLREHRVPYRFDDKRLRRPVSRPLVYSAPFTPGEDQTSAAARLVKVKQGIVEGVCGSGKSEILLMAAAQTGQRTLISVHTERLLRQWVQRIQSRYGLGVDDIGVYSGKKKTVRDVTLVMQQTLFDAAPTLGQEFGCYVQDEVHHAAARTFFEGTDYLPALYRFAASATLKRKDGKGFLIYDLFGHVLAQITDEDLFRMGRVYLPEVEVVPTNFYYPYRGELSGKSETDPLARRAYREMLKEARQAGTNVDGDWVGFVTAAAGDETRNAVAMHKLLRDYHAGHSSLLLVDRRDLCFAWRDFLKETYNIDCGLLVGASGGKGGVKSKDIDVTLGRIEDRDLRVAVGTTVADEGLDAPVLDRLHLLTPTANHKERITQQVGRIKRKAEGKTDAKAYYYWDWRIPEFYDHLATLRRIFDNVTLDGEEVRRYDELSSLL